MRRWQKIGSRPGQYARTHNSWSGMRQRCQNESAHGFAAYGGRGIRVCERWQDFELFLLDMGPRPLGKTIDRIDADGHYEPGNCRWASAKLQTLNRRPRSMWVPSAKKAIKAKRRANLKSKAIELRNWRAEQKENMRRRKRN